MKTLLILDCYAICHAAKYAMGDLSHEEQKTGIVFGFMHFLYFLKSEYFNAEIAFAWDSKHSKRKKIYPGYKNRTQDKTPEQIATDKLSFPQFNDLRRKVLPSLEFKNIFQQKGHEADDIMHIIAVNSKKYKIVLVTRDKDMWQTLRNHVSILDPQTKKIMTKKMFMEKWGVHPRKWGVAKAYAGCKTDTVGGIMGIGESTAIKYMNGELNPGHKTFQNIESNLNVFERNKALVILPFKGTKMFNVRETRSINKRAFLKMCDQYGFDSFVTTKNFPKWKKRFNIK